MVLEEQDGLYAAGHVAPPGRYLRVEPPGERIVVLKSDDFLPASLDGRIAVYRRVPPAFAAIGSTRARAGRRVAARRAFSTA